jgi:hypothetical protein
MHVCLQGWEAHGKLWGLRCLVVKLLSEIFDPMHAYRQADLPSTLNNPQDLCCLGIVRRASALTTNVP